MPLTQKGQTILRELIERHGKKTGTSNFFASINKGTITGAEKKGQGHG